MKDKIAIYLAGHIKKSNEQEDVHWTEGDKETIQRAFGKAEVTFLDPQHRMDSLTDSTSIFGRDMLQVFASDAVFVDARKRRGLGVGAEMMWAKVNNIPVVTLSPKESHYNQAKFVLLDVQIQNYIHPFVASLSDAVVETCEEGALWLQAWFQNPLNEAKGIKSIHSCIDYYLENQLENDIPMQDILAKHTVLSERIAGLSS